MLHKWKEYWLNADLVPSQKEDTQIKYLIDTLKRELDLNNISNILEVGVGYGRVAKGLLSYFSTDQLVQPMYVGLDISYETLKRSEQYLEPEATSLNYVTYHSDFETECVGLARGFELVISVETMSVVPYDVK